MSRLFLAACLILLFALPTNGTAQSRWVAVNGQWLSDRQIANLEATYGIGIADGNYWYNPSTRAWGFVGNPTIQGYLVPNSATGAGVGGPGYNRNTAGGAMMSDGTCSFVLGVPVGDC